MRDEWEEVQVELVDDSLKYCESQLNQICRMGYPMAYVLQSLESEQLNHVTAFYHLLAYKFHY